MNKKTSMISALASALFGYGTFTQYARVMVRYTKVSTYKKGGKEFTKGKLHRSQRVRANRRKARRRR